MIPHSAARLCNTVVVTVLGGQVVLAMYQQGIGHVCFGVLLLMPVQSLRWEHFLATLELFATSVCIEVCEQK